jgi:hypothetical protein
MSLSPINEMGCSYVGSPRANLKSGSDYSAPITKEYIYIFLNCTYLVRCVCVLLEYRPPRLKTIDLEHDY